MGRIERNKGETNLEQIERIEREKIWDGLREYNKRKQMQEGLREY